MLDSQVMSPRSTRQRSSILGCTVALSLLASACAEQTTVQSDRPSTTQPAAAATTTSGEDTKPMLGMGVIEAADGDYEAAFDAARSAGVEIIPLTLFWNAVEPTAGSIDLGLPSIANAFYPPRHTAIALSLVAIDGPGPALPQDLAGRSVDDPEVIARYESMLAEVAGAMPDVNVEYLSLSNEIDLLLHNDSDWAAFGRFYDAVAPLASELWPDAVIGATTTAGSALGSQATAVAAFNRHAGSWLVTWYPLDSSFHVLSPPDALAQLGEIEALTGNLPLHLMEVGYPSDGANLSSEDMQAEFFAEFLRFVNGRGDELPLTIIEWETDLAPGDASETAGRYGLPDNEAFVAYLASLGLRTHDGNPKAAWRVLAKCANDC